MEKAFLFIMFLCIALIMGVLRRKAFAAFQERTGLHPIFIWFALVGSLIVFVLLTR